jgi:hypothetical protein
MKEELSRAVPPLLALAALFLGCEEENAPPPEAPAPELRVEGLYSGTSSAAELEYIAFYRGQYQIHRSADRWEHGSFARSGGTITFTPDDGPSWSSALETFAKGNIKTATLITGDSDLLPGAGADKIRLTSGKPQELVAVKDPQSIVLAAVGDRIVSPSIRSETGVPLVYIVSDCPTGVIGVPPGRCFKLDWVSGK